MKNQKGITLIALVITIIVLLILAGISIAMLTSNDGILTRATGAVDRDTLERERERAMLDYNAAKEAWYEAKYAPATEDERTTDDFDTWIKVKATAEKYFKTTEAQNYYTLTAEGTAAPKVTLKTKGGADGNTNVDGTISDTGIEWTDKTE